jgi:ATP-dependent exoDNAse (exonuclease V) beta subunit
MRNATGAPHERSYYPTDLYYSNLWMDHDPSSPVRVHGDFSTWDVNGDGKSDLAVANALIEHNVERKPKSLWTQEPGGELAVRYRADNEHEEALFVAEEVERLVDAEGYRYRDIALFYRTNAQSRVLEDIFMKVGLPYRIVGGVRFYARKEVKDVLAYLNETGLSPVTF